MATETDVISSQTDLKHNFANGDNETDSQDLIIRDKLRLWEKIIRIQTSGTETTNVVQNAEPTHASTLSTSVSLGYRFYVNSDCKLVDVTKVSSSNPVRVQLLDDAGTVIASANFSSNVATFSVPQTLTSGTYYRLECNSSGSTYTVYRDTSPAYPYNNTYVNFTSSSVAGAGTITTYAYIIPSVTVSYDTALPSTEEAVILPFNTLYEPMYTDDDIDYSTITIPIPEETQLSESTMATTGSTTTSAGVRAYTNFTCQLKSITKHSSCTATRATIKADTGGTILASATYIGDVATFSTPYILTAGTYYRLESDNSGSSYTYRGRNSGQTFPYTNDYLDFTIGSVAGGNNAIPYNVISATVITGVEITNTTTTAEYDSTNEWFKFYNDTNGTYDVLQSKTISLLHNYRLYSLSITVFAYDNSDNILDSGYDLQIYNGNEWFNVSSGSEFILREYNGADLDADLDAELSGYLLNYDTNDNILFQNDIRYKITRTTTDDMYVKKIIMKLTYLPELPTISGWLSVWGVWGTP